MEAQDSRVAPGTQFEINRHSQANPEQAGFRDSSLHINRNKEQTFGTPKPRGNQSPEKAADKALHADLVGSFSPNQSQSPGYQTSKPSTFSGTANQEQGAKPTQPAGEFSPDYGAPSLHAASEHPDPQSEQAALKLQKILEGQKPPSTQQSQPQQKQRLS